MTANDMRDIHAASERSRLLTIPISALVIVAAFVAGYLVGVTSAPQQSYPYSAVAAGPSMAAGSRKRRWLLGVVLAILAFSSFFIGVNVGNPSLGVVTYYGAYSGES